MDLPILTSAQMRVTEEAAFANGVPVEALMNKAGAGVARVVTNFFAKPGLCIVFAGKGHNAGDALFALAFEVISKLKAPSDQVAKAISILATSSGSAGCSAPGLRRTG